MKLQYMYVILMINLHTVKPINKIVMSGIALGF